MAEHWTRQEESLLKREYDKGTSLRRIVKIFEDMSKVQDSGFTIRTNKALQRKIENLGLLRRHESLIEGKRVGHLDIESSQLNAYFGIILSWAIKENGGDTIYFDCLKSEDFSQKDKLCIDKRIVASLVEALKGFDVITTYYGERFDLPFIRSRALKCDVPFPEYGNIYSVDMWKVARDKLKLHSNRLDAVAGFLGVNSKTKLEPEIWIRAILNDPSAMKYVVKHNIEDVKTLDKVYNKLRTFTAGTRRSI